MNLGIRRGVSSQTLLLIVALLAAGLRNALADSGDSQQWEQLMASSSKSLRGSNNVPAAIQLCDQALSLAAKFAPPDTRLSQSQVLRAEVYLWEKKNDRAEQTFKLAVTSCEKAAGSNDVSLVHPLSSLANFYQSGVPRYDEVAPLYARILKIVENAPARNPRDIIMWSRNLGGVYQHLNQYGEAEPLYKQAVALAEENDPAWAPYELLTAADFYRAWRKYEPAEQHAQRALTLREQKLKTDDGIDAQTDIATCLNNLGATYLAWSKPSEAESAYRRSLAITEKFSTEDQANLLPQLEGLSAALTAQAKLDEAKALRERIEKIRGEKGQK